MYQKEFKDVLAFRAKTLLLGISCKIKLEGHLSFTLGCQLRFTVCDLCEHYKAALQDSSLSMAEKLGSLRSYRSHLRDQYTDRSILWQLCDLSYAHEGDLMVIWIDGMEQAKFAIPRSRGLKTASALIRGCTYDFLGYQTHLFQNHLWFSFKYKIKLSDQSLQTIFWDIKFIFFKIISDSVSNTNSNFQTKAY